MRKIIIDTNFLLIPFTQKVDIFSELERIMGERYQLFMIDKTVAELENIIAKQKGKNKEAAQFALKLLQKKPLEVITTNSEDDVDTEILKLLKDEDYYTCTQDKPLKKKIADLGRRVIVLRQKSHLALL